MFFVRPKAPKDYKCAVCYSDKDSLKSVHHLKTRYRVRILRNGACEPDEPLTRERMGRSYFNKRVFNNETFPHVAISVISQLFKHLINASST